MALHTARLAVLGQDGGCSHGQVLAVCLHHRCHPGDSAILVTVYNDLLVWEFLVRGRGKTPELLLPHTPEAVLVDVPRRPVYSHVPDRSFPYGVYEILPLGIRQELGVFDPRYVGRGWESHDAHEEVPREGPTACLVYSDHDLI